MARHRVLELGYYISTNNLRYFYVMKRTHTGREFNPRDNDRPHQYNTERGTIFQRRMGRRNVLLMCSGAYGHYATVADYVTGPVKLVLGRYNGELMRFGQENFDKLAETVLEYNKAYSNNTDLDVSDFVRGCAFFSTGGGGDPKLGLEFLLKVFRGGKPIGWVDAKTVDDEAWVCSPAGMGSIAPLTQEKQDMFMHLGLKEKKVKDTIVEAVLELEKYLNTKIDVIVPGEIGGYNTSVPIGTASFACWFGRRIFFIS